MPPGADHPLSAAARGCSDPAATIRRFKALTGRKAVALLSPVVPAAVVEAAGMLPVSIHPQIADPGVASLAESLRAVDALVLAPAEGVSGAVDMAALRAAPERMPVFRLEVPEPGGDRAAEELLDAVERFIEWASELSGEAVNEGDLHRAILADNANRELKVRLSAAMAESPGLYGAAEFVALARAGTLLGSRAHSRLLRAALAARQPAGPGAARGLFLYGRSPSVGIVKALDEGGARLCGADLPEWSGSAVRPLEERGDAAVAIARCAAAAAETERRRGSAGIAERAARDSGAAGLVLLEAKEGGGRAANSVESAGRGRLPEIRIAADAPFGDRDVARLKEFLDALHGRGNG